MFAGIWMHSKSSTFEMSFCVFAGSLTLPGDFGGNIHRGTR